MSIYLDGRDWEASARAVARGDDTRAVIKVPVRVKPDRFGVHTMSLEVQVRNALVDSFLPQEGDLDPFRQALVYDPGSLLITYGELGRGIIACDFRGIIQSRVNQYTMRKAGFGERTVTLRDAGGNTVSVTYRSPRAIYTYAASTDPLTPQFAGQMEPASTDFEILSIRAGDIELLEAGVTLGGLEAAGYPWSTEVRSTTFDREEDGAGVWRCTEVNEGIILSDIGGA